MNEEGVFCGDKKLIVGMVRLAAWMVALIERRFGVVL